MRYPLEAAETVRGVAKDAAVDRLAKALEAQARTQARRERAAGALAEHRQAEEARLGRGRARQPVVVRAADLQYEARYRERQREEGARLEAALKRAEAAAHEAAREVARAREALADAAAEAQVVARHRERWEAAERRRAERAEESEAEDGGQRRR
jgi:hypothetical protein